MKAYATDLKLFVRDDLESGEGLDIFVKLYLDHQIDLPKWSNKS